MDKLIRDGKVAVLYSPGFGAGWSTWILGENEEKVLFDPDIAAAVLEEDYTRALHIAEERYPEEYLGGLEDLVVAWVPQGAQFEITEYDGSEGLHIIGTQHYWTA